MIYVLLFTFLSFAHAEESLYGDKSYSGTAPTEEQKKFLDMQNSGAGIPFISQQFCNATLNQIFEQENLKAMIVKIEALQNGTKILTVDPRCFLETIAPAKEVAASLGAPFSPASAGSMGYGMGMVPMPTTVGAAFIGSNTQLSTPEQLEKFFLEQKSKWLEEREKQLPVYKRWRLFFYLLSELKASQNQINVEKFCLKLDLLQQREKKFGAYYPITRLSMTDFANSGEIREFAIKFGITEAELSAVQLYTGAYYSEINPALWGKALNPAQNTYVDFAASALAKLPAYQGLSIRVACLPPAAVEEHKKGAIVTYSAFTSASAKRDWQWQEGCSRFYVCSSEKGKKISSLSTLPAEEEVLFPPNTKFRISGSAPLLGAKKQQRVYLLEEIHGDGIGSAEKGHCVEAKKRLEVDLQKFLSYEAHLESLKTELPKKNIGLQEKVKALNTEKQTLTSSFNPTEKRLAQIDDEIGQMYQKSNLPPMGDDGIMNGASTGMHSATYIQAYAEQMQKLGDERTTLLSGAGLGGAKSFFRTQMIKAELSSAEFEIRMNNNRLVEIPEQILEYREELKKWKAEQQ